MRQELEQLLDTHRAQRPEMQPQDYYKLLYQREFGCGHTAPAPETAERHLMEEYARAAGLPVADAVPEHVKGAALPGCVEDKMCIRDRSSGAGRSSTISSRPAAAQSSMT